jgi:hypothetical protein
MEANWKVDGKVRYRLYENSKKTELERLMQTDLIESLDYHFFWNGALLETIVSHGRGEAVNPFPFELHYVCGEFAQTRGHLNFRNTQSAAPVAEILRRRKHKFMLHPHSFTFSPIPHFSKWQTRSVLQVFTNLICRSESQKTLTTLWTTWSPQWRVSSAPLSY